MSNRVRCRQSDDQTFVLTARPRRFYFWTSVELFHLLLRSLRPAKWRLWFDWKERTQDCECLRSKRKGNEYTHCCKFPARRLYRNQSPFIILLRDLSAQVLKELDRPPLAILARAENFKIFRRAVRFFRQHNPNSDRRAKHYYERTRRTFPHHLRTV